MSTYIGGDDFADQLTANYSGVDGTDLTVINEMRVKAFTVPAVAATAGTALAEGILCAPMCPTQFGIGVGTAVARPYRVLGWQVTAGGAITASDTLFATFNVYSRTSAGATQVLIGTLATTTAGSGSFAAFQSIAGSVTKANSIVPAGGTITFEILKASTGTAVPAGTVITLFAEMA